MSPRTSPRYSRTRSGFRRATRPGRGDSTSDCQPRRIPLAHPQATRSGPLPPPGPPAPPRPPGPTAPLASTGSVSTSSGSAPPACSPAPSSDSNAASTTPPNAAGARPVPPAPDRPPTAAPTRPDSPDGPRSSAPPRPGHRVGRSPAAVCEEVIRPQRDGGRGHHGARLIDPSPHGAVPGGTGSRGGPVRGRLAESWASG